MSAKRLPLSDHDPLDDIRRLVGHDLPALPAIENDGGKLGDFAPLWRWLRSTRHGARNGLNHPRVALFFSGHGAFPDIQRDLRTQLARLSDGKHEVSALAQAANADLQAYELDLDRPSRDFRRESALTAEETAQAMAYGMMAVQPGVDLLVVNAPNPAADLAAREIRRALQEKNERGDSLDALMRFGGFDIAAMAGAIIAARLAKIPVMAEGAAAIVAVEILSALQPRASDHVRDAASILAEKTNLPAPCRSLLLIPLLKSLVEID